MRKILHRLFNLILKFKLFYKLFKILDDFIHNHIYQANEYYQFKKMLHNENTSFLLGELKVLNGPFKGMKYPNFTSFGSSIFPKLIGSYEHELHSIINSFYKKNYNIILDIGCAEGYYAVGLARLLPNTELYAYDISEEAINLCKKMALLNNINNRIIYNTIINEKILHRFNFTQKSLIICDCEGFEKYIFTEFSVNNLNNCDLLIETHDMYDLEISYYLENLFKETHNLIKIYSTDDIQKSKIIKYKELEQFNINEKKILLQEQRTHIMEWHYYTSKSSN